MATANSGLIGTKVITQLKKIIAFISGEHVGTQLRKSFFTGLFVIIPISVTIYILIFLIELLNNLLPFYFLPYGTGIVLTVILITLIGFMTSNLLGQKLIDTGERLISNIPLVKNVYAAVKQISDAVRSSTGKNYRRVVLIQYPRKGIYTLAFVTGVSEGEIQEKTQDKVINLFVPTTPNPTSGFYLMVPETDVTDLDMSVEDAFKLLISGGMVSSDLNRSK
jgi:uncharacterized membrane protein